MDIMMSISTEWCDKIFGGEKKFEVRKTVPKNMGRIVYVYRTSNGGVIGEFKSKYVIELPNPATIKDEECDFDFLLRDTCLTKKQLLDYIGDKPTFYKYRISFPKLYETPRPLSDFGLSRPPQSWCYIWT